MASPSLFSKERRYLFASVLIGKLLNRGKKPNNIVPRSILVVKLDEIGDMAIAMCVFAMLKRDYPNARLTVLCQPFVKPLIASDPFIDEIFVDINQWNHTYDVVIEFRGTMATVRKALIFRPRLRLDRATIRLKNKLGNGQLHEADTNLEVLTPLLRTTTPIVSKITIDPAIRKEVNTFLSANNLERYAVIVPGARRALRRWPYERFAETIRWVYDTYGLKTVCAGGAEDQLINEAIVASSNGHAMCAPYNYSLQHFTALCEGASLFVGNDSGPLHIANSCGIPVVGIYGPGVPHVQYPKGMRSTYIHHVLDCNPCDQIHCIRPELPCTLLVTTDEVREAIKRVINVHQLE